MNRREALLKLLRLAGAGAGSAALGFWLDQRSMRPEQALVMNAKRSHSIAPKPIAGAISVGSLSKNVSPGTATANE